MNDTETIETVHLQPEAQAAWSGLEARVAGVQTRHRATFLSTGLGVALAVIFGAFLAFSAGDILFKFSTATRLLVAFGTLTGIVLVLAWQVLRPWIKMGGTQHVAANVEQTFPQLENQLSTALEYGRNPELARLTSSPALVSAMIQQAATKSQSFDFARTVRWRPVLLAAILAFFLAAGVIGYAAYSPRLFKTTLSRFISPAADIPAPTLTVIRQVLPGESEVPVETSVPVEVSVEGQAPETATLSVFIPEANAIQTSTSEANGSAGHWEDRPMERGVDGIYRATLRRLLENTRYKIEAGDDHSQEFKISVFKIPEISKFVLRLDPPAYTGKSSETLAPDTGDVHALKGTLVHVEIHANTDLSGAQVVFKSGRPMAAFTVEAQDKRKATGSFMLETDDEYQLHISNSRGSGSSSKYLLKALKDRAPKVLITKPERDLSVHREQTLSVEISAEDDVGVREIGVFHSMGLEESKTMVRKVDPTLLRVEGKLVWDLGKLGLKGGEVIAYYAYAIDNDTLNSTGPKMSKSEIHFLTIYDEEQYDSAQPTTDPKQKKHSVSPAIKQLDKMIETQKKILKESFAQARIQQAEKGQTENGQSEKKPPVDKAALQKTLAAQKQLQTNVQELFDSVKKDLEAKDPAEPSEPKDPHGSGPKPDGDSGLGEKELKHMEHALDKMGEAQTQLKIPDAEKSVKPEIEALRSLSQTRNLLLSDKAGDPRFKVAMNKKSKKNQEHEQQQQQQDQQSAKEELAELPKMLERQKESEREAEHLSERKHNNPPPANNMIPTEAQKKEQAEQHAEEQALQKKLDKLAKESEERARKLERLAERDTGLQSAAEKMQQASDKTQQAASEAKTPNEKNLASVQQKMQSAENATRQAQHEMRNAMDKQIRQELSNVQKDAQELAARQQEIADQTQQMQNEKNNPPQPSPSKPDGAKPGSQEQRMKGLAGQQRGINNDLRELSERMEALGEKAAEKGLAGAAELDKARQQSKENSPAAQAGLNSQAALSAKSGDAKNSSEKNIEAANSEAQKAAKALEQLSQTLKGAMQKTAAGDMKTAAAAMKKLQSLAQEQSEISKELSAAAPTSAPASAPAQPKQTPASLGELSEKEEQVSNGVREVASQIETLEVLRQNGRDASTQEKLDEASKQTSSAKEALKSGDVPSAKSAAENAEKSLNQALAEMERATGKTLEEKAREAQSLARSARENQENAAQEIKTIPAPKTGEKLPSALAEKRDDATHKEAQAARDAKRLEQALNGLQELAQEANPVAAEAAAQGKELLDEKNLPKKMEELAKSMAQIGQPKKATPTLTPASETTPAEAASEGEQHAQTLRQAEKQLDHYIAEAVGTQLDKLRNMEQAAREAAQKAEQLALENNASTDPLEKELERLGKRLEKLEATAPEKIKLNEAITALQQPRNSGGPAMQRASKALGEVAGGIVTRIERLLRAREVHAQEDEDAPKEYRTLVDQYYRALSDDMEGQ